MKVQFPTTVRTYKNNTQVHSTTLWFCGKVNKRAFFHKAEILKMKITISTPLWGRREIKKKRCQKVDNEIDILLTKINAVPPKKRELPIVWSHSLAIDWTAGVPALISEPICTIAHRGQQKYAAKSPTKEPSIPFCSLNSCLCIAPQMTSGNPKRDANPHKKQLWPRASAFLPNW